MAELQSINQFDDLIIVMTGAVLILISIGYARWDYYKSVKKEVQKKQTGASIRAKL